MRKSVVAILLTIAFLFLLLPVPAAQADGFDVNSLRERYAILVSTDDPTTALYGIEKNADTQCSTGSTIKILTCMLAIESGRLDEVATVSDNAVNFNKKYNSLMGLGSGICSTGSCFLPATTPPSPSPNSWQGPPRPSPTR